jgi:hypothetical protein
MHSDISNFNQSSTKNANIQRRQTIGTAHARPHLTPLKQLKAKFWPARQSHNIDIKEHEQMPMINKKQTKTIQRSFSTGERNHPNMANDNLNE